MTLLAVERIKLFSTRSAWWCGALPLVIVIGFATLIAANADADFPLSIPGTLYGYQYGLAVVLVMATVAVTSEYRFGTMRATFLAVPNRVGALLGKTTLVALVSGIIGLLAAGAALVVATLISPEFNLMPDTAADWRHVAGIGPVYAISAVIAVAVGILVRHTAGAVALLLIYSTAVEDLIQYLPKVGPSISEWLPFNMAGHFLTGNPDPSNPPGPQLTHAALSPWWSLAYFAGVAGLLLTVALITAKKRDA